MTSIESASPGPTPKTADANPKFGLAVSDGGTPNDIESTNINTAASTLISSPKSNDHIHFTTYKLLLILNYSWQIVHEISRGLGILMGGLMNK